MEKTIPKWDNMDNSNQIEYTPWLNIFAVPSYLNKEHSTLIGHIMSSVISILYPELRISNEDIQDSFMWMNTRERNDLWQRYYDELLGDIQNSYH